MRNPISAGALLLLCAAAPMTLAGCPSDAPPTSPAVTIDNGPGLADSPFSGDDLQRRLSRDTLIVEPIPRDSLWDTDVMPLDSVLEFQVRRLRCGRCGPDTYGLKMWTGYYGCANYEVVYTTRFTGHRFLIDISGYTLVPPDMCYDAFAPAHATVELPTMPPGRYQLQITYGTQRDHYQLIVQDNRVDIIPRQVSFTLAHPDRRTP